MTDVLDSASLIDAAQEAIAVGDYRKAERLMRDATAALEAGLGPEHPELARTLHDYAFICERTNNLVEAEQSYRRAHAIAVKALSPRDPFVAATVKDLLTFCTAHKIPIWKPPASAPSSEGADGAHQEINELDVYASEAGTPKVETKAIDAERSDIAESAPIESAPIKSAPFDAGAFESAIEPVASEPDPFETASFEPSPSAGPFEDAPFEDASFEDAPFEAAALEDAPLEAAPLHAAAFEARPLEAAPIESAPFESAPIEAAPFEAGPPETDQFDTTPIAPTTERYARIDPVLPHAVPVAVRARVVRRRRDVTGRVIALLVGAAVVIVAVPFAIRWSRTSFSGIASDQPAIAQPSTPPAAPPAIEVPSTRAEAPAPAPATPPPSNATPAKPVAATPPVVAPPTRRAAGATTPQVTVLNAQLCRTITKQGSPDWKCTPAEGNLRPGNYFFYTRLLASANTKVEHRWYRDDREHKVITLSITASPGVGYRTISSTNIAADRTGNWRVEVRAADGTLLQEHSFVIAR